MPERRSVLLASDKALIFDVRSVTVQWSISGQSVRPTDRPSHSQRVNTSVDLQWPLRFPSSPLQSVSRSVGVPMRWILLPVMTSLYPVGHHTSLHENISAFRDINIYTLPALHALWQKQPNTRYRPTTWLGQCSSVFRVSLYLAI